jgi:aspartate-semialdehyde dehydrogenase
MSSPQEAVRVAIVGAASLRGKELKLWLEESSFPASEIRLLDEEVMAGTLTEAGGEPAVIKTVTEDSFERVRIAFFTGSAKFSALHGMEASRSGAVVIDLSGGLGGKAGAKPWIPALDSVLASPAAKVTAGEARGLFLIPSTPAQVAISVSAAFAPIGLERLAFTIFQPASERGTEGIEELESQVVNLLSFKPISQIVYDAQVGFNMLSRYGPESAEKLADDRAKIIGEVETYLSGRALMPAIALVQAPVFHTHTFTAYAEFRTQPVLEDLVSRLKAAGLKIVPDTDEPPNNVNVAGEERPVLGQPERDPGIEDGVWLWGAADNLRVPVTTAVAVAEKLLAS